MGTSSSGGGGKGYNPLIPSWIGGEGVPLPPDQPKEVDVEVQDSDIQGDPNSNKIPSNITPIDSTEIQNADINSRFTGPRRQLNRFVRSKGEDKAAAKQALKKYSRTAAGSTAGMAKRMQPSIGRVAIFFDTIDTIRRRGVTTALAEFNLSAFVNRPVLEILSAVGDLIFSDTGRLYDNTQDDSITKSAYANTVTRLCEESPDLDLNNLSNEQVEVMMAVFIEETIAQRVINDIGNQFTELTTNVTELLDIENGIYQIVSGLVRTQIMPEISATRRGNRENLERNIQNIYRIAFDTMAGIND